MSPMKHGMEVAAHLGGYIPGGDMDTWYPDLWRWLVEEQGVGLVLDVGCGEGVALNEFRRLGASGIGVEGVAQDDEQIITHDFTTGPWPTPGSYFHPDFGHPGFDLVWSCEFVEHVAEEFIPNFLPAFRLGALLLMTHAVPGQGGWHHVNCQPGTYWIEKIEAAGFEIDVELTAEARRLAKLNERPVNYFRDTGMAFRRA